MILWYWLKGLLRTAAGRLAGTALGIALAAALLTALGLFVESAAGTMTARAVAGLPIDWQIQLAPGADRAAVEGALADLGRTSAVRAVEYATVDGFVANTDGTQQVTGPGQAIGVASDYFTAFPGQIALLAGSPDGPVLFSQTAANLHAGVGDSVSVRRPGLPAVQITVAGVAALPNVDSLFQAVGVARGLQPQSPPDNILILPAATWHRLFDPQRQGRPDSASTQLHVRIDRGSLPRDPVAAYRQVVAMTNNLAARLAGSAAIADNLAARLDGVRDDALYAEVLFLFLGAPGVALAGLLAGSVAAAGNPRRRREQALLRLRGAGTGQVLSRPAVEAAVAGLAGGCLGLLIAVAVATLLGLAAPMAAFVRWSAIGAAGSLALALAVVLLPAVHDLRTVAIAGARREVARRPRPLWQRAGLDVALIGLAIILFLRMQATGYQIVLATEGVAQTSVHYESFLAPLALWAGLGLLWVRLSLALVGPGRALLDRLIRPLAGDLADLVAASLSRQAGRLARGAGLLALAAGFAVSTALFDVTYDAQARVDAELTNGADVNVAGSAAAPAGARLEAIRRVPGVAAAEPMMHRYAYVGADLQDLFGIDPARLGRATTLANAYFSSGSAAGVLGKLAATPDGVLVSEETVRDFQLQLGDKINLRLQSAADHQYHVVPFRFVGVAREFPSAPKDSFLVANAGYIARMTGDPASEVVLVRTSMPAATAERLRAALGTGSSLTVTPLGAVQSLISSSLTAVSLAGLTRVELGFGLLLMAAIAGVVLGLGFAERQRTYATLAALGATPRQIGAFLRSEALLVAAVGLVCGLATGVAVAAMLVAMLSGVFDPPPEAMAVPVGYLATVLAAAAAASIVVVLLFERLHRRLDPSSLKQ